MEDSRGTRDSGFTDLKLYPERQHGHQKHFENIRMITTNTYILRDRSFSKYLTYITMLMHATMSRVRYYIFIPILQMRKLKLRSLEEVKLEAEPRLLTTLCVASCVNHLEK